MYHNDCWAIYEDFPLISREIDKGVNCCEGLSLNLARLYIWFAWFDNLCRLVAGVYRGMNAAHRESGKIESFVTITAWFSLWEK